MGGPERRPGRHHGQRRDPCAGGGAPRGPEVQADYVDDWDICLDGGVARLALNRFLVQWRKPQTEAATIRAAARWLVDDYVIF